MTDIFNLGLTLYTGTLPIVLTPSNPPEAPDYSIR